VKKKLKRLCYNKRRIDSLIFKKNEKRE